MIFVQESFQISIAIMKILLKYLKPHKWLVTLVLTLAAINIGFSLVDPILFGKLINLDVKIFIGFGLLQFGEIFLLKFDKFLPCLTGEFNIWRFN